MRHRAVRVRPESGKLIRGVGNVIQAAFGRLFYWRDRVAELLKREGVIRPLQWRKAVQTAGIAAARLAASGIGLLREIATGARAQLIDGATDADADGSLERNAAPRLIASTAHVSASTEDRVIFGKCSGYPSPGLGIEFLA